MKRLPRSASRPTLSLVRDRPAPPIAPRPRPVMPRGCVRVFPVLGGYMAVAFDRAGEARREVRCAADDWAHGFDQLTEWLRSIGEIAGESPRPRSLTLIRGGLG